MVENNTTLESSRFDPVPIGTLRIERWLLERIDDLAVSERRNRNQQIHKMLEEWDAVLGPEVRQKQARIRAAREGSPPQEEP